MEALAILKPTRRSMLQRPSQGARVAAGTPEAGRAAYPGKPHCGRSPTAYPPARTAGPTTSWDTSPSTPAVDRWCDIRPTAATGACP
jgi:hypothetical protein